jgi:hypothetical protein
VSKVRINLNRQTGPWVDRNGVLHEGATGQHDELAGALRLERSPHVVTEMMDDLDFASCANGKNASEVIALRQHDGVGVDRGRVLGQEGKRLQIRRLGGCVMYELAKEDMLLKMLLR